MGAIVALVIWLAGTVGVELTFETAKLIAEKAFLTAIILFVLPIGLFKGFEAVMKFALSYAASKVGSSGFSPQLLQLTGTAGYVASHLKVPQAVSVMLSAVCLSFTLRFLKIK